MKKNSDHKDYDDKIVFNRKTPKQKPDKDWIVYSKRIKEDPIPSFKKEPLDVWIKDIFNKYLTPDHYKAQHEKHLRTYNKKFSQFLYDDREWKIINRVTNEEIDIIIDFDKKLINLIKTE